MWQKEIHEKNKKYSNSINKKIILKNVLPFWVFSSAIKKKMRESIKKDNNNNNNMVDEVKDFFKEKKKKIQETEMKGI